MSSLIVRLVVPLSVQALQYSSRAGESVLDLFGGSGSTLIAAEQTGRRAFLMELDPLYCDVIIERWERFTGQAASAVSRGWIYGTATIAGPRHPFAGAGGRSLVPQVGLRTPANVLGGAPPNALCELPFPTSVVNTDARKRGRFQSSGGGDRRGIGKCFMA